MVEYFEIGYFQLENLMLNQVKFHFFDIRPEKTPVSDEPLKSMMGSCVPLEKNEVSTYLKENVEDKKTPIVLMCKDGSQSAELASELNEESYINVNIIEGGFDGLLEESQSMTHS